MSLPPQLRLHARIESFSERLFTLLPAPHSTLCISRHLSASSLSLHLHGGEEGEEKGAFVHEDGESN